MVYVEAMTSVNHSPLEKNHLNAGGKLVDFAGFMMPMQYSGIVNEHHAVRQKAGIFDVSHMGQVDFFGDQALLAVDRLVTNNAQTLVDGQALYTPICHPHGGIVDDCIVYRFNEKHMRIVVNASNIEKDFKWFNEANTYPVDIKNRSEEYALIALQGPLARSIWSTIAGEQTLSIGVFHFAECKVGNISCLAARTGYTGEDGYEIFVSPNDAPALWERLIEVGGPKGLLPCGLGARDTLRLEARLPLYGNDISDDTTPLEAGLSWTVKLKADDFIGKDALLTQKKEGIKRKLVCIEMRGKGIARHGYPIHPSAEEEAFGEITSGTKSPTLNKAIALGYVPKSHAKSKTQLSIAIRSKMIDAEVVKGPFYKKSDI